uniref:Predicted protein n=1 Tax=Hordeum vulgare subsp. vulgare TaxID=112509 RepID=F2DVS6_HORVV|nr:predicted protein [Hordeum vulgare subsp. vulgare]
MDARCPIPSNTSEPASLYSSFVHERSSLDQLAELGSWTRRLTDQDSDAFFVSKKSRFVYFLLPWKGEREEGFLFTRCALRFFCRAVFKDDD